MTPRHIHVLKKFFEARLGSDWESSQPRRLTPAEALEALWPLNTLFQSNYHLIQSLPYSAKYEREADRALEKLALGEKWSPREPKPIVWRVLLERHIQSMVVIQANQINGSESISTIPFDLPQEHTSLAVALFLQYEMKLILPIGKHLPKSLPACDSPISFARH